MIGEHYLEDTLLQLRKLKDLAERAMAQVAEEDFFALLDAEANSIALVMKHMAGNMRSRWTDFLSTDGEKPDRARDTEFERAETDSRAALEARWQESWKVTLEAIGGLRPEDLERTVTIRGEPHTVLQAINRQLTHYAYHVGQIVLLAKHRAGERWQSLSIPRGQSKEYEVAREGRTYRPQAESAAVADSAERPAGDPARPAGER
jgi:uncharacterized damage-inducible protein DinB